MGNPLDENSNKNYARLITLSWHTTTVHYAAYTSSIVIDTDTFIALPAISVEFSKFEGEVKETPTKLYLPTTHSPANLLLRPYPFAPITVQIDEVDPTNTTTRRRLFQGTISKIYRNPQGLHNCIALDIAGPKSKLDIPLGMMANTTCPWQFGDAWCGRDINLFKIDTTILAVDGISLTLNHTTTEAAYWHRGYVLKDGISVMIRDADHSDLTLIKLPLPEWVAGTTITVYPGCDKTIETCRSRWNNENRFAGAGYAMPAYSPLFGLEG